jgi:hypothetical protein
MLGGCAMEPTITAKEITANSISALSKAKTYGLAANVINNYEIIGGNNPHINTARWNSTRFFNIPNKEMNLTMTIDTEYFGAKGHWAIDMYFFNGWKYLHTVIPDNSWSKTKLTDELWVAESQIPLQVELLKTATEITLVGNDNIDGVDCYVLAVTPAKELIADWVQSQQQEYGPSLDISWSPALVGRDTFIKTYKSSSVKEWINKRSYLLVKSDVNALFEAKPEDIGASGAQFEKIKSTFLGEMKFSDYNGASSISLPNEALNAPER